MITIDDDIRVEIQERCSAELEFVSAAYTLEEAWISAAQNQIHRRLDLSMDQQQTRNGGTIELVLSMPSNYPIDPDSILQIEAFFIPLTPSSSFGGNASIPRKLILDAIPRLLLACRESAREQAGQEAIFTVMNRANDWVEEDWVNILDECKRINCSIASHTCIDNTNNNNLINDDHECCTTQGRSGNSCTLGRRLIYSHHIIAKTKRKAILNLAKEYDLGGFVKIGWPGIIIIEGLEENCILFVDIVSAMRWKYLVVRGEEQEEQERLSTLEENRKLPKSFEELGDHQMSFLSGICRDVGLEDLFLTSMKIYNKNIEHQSEEVSIPPNTSTFLDTVYGALIHVDHMNDTRSYKKWIHQVCKTAHCDKILKQCHPNDDTTKKGIILVGLWGDKKSVKQVIKRWRTSRVDVDSQGKPCLERMMRILVDGNLERSMEGIKIELDDKDNTFVDCSKKISLFLRSIGGSIWEEAFLALLP